MEILKEHDPFQLRAHFNHIYATGDMASEEPPRFLLLLPPAPSPLSHSTLKAAFGDTLSQVLKEVASASSESKDAAILEIATSCPHLVGKQQSPRSNVYAETQSLVASLYKLICVTAAKDGVNVEDADGVDVRILLVAWSPDESSSTARQPFGPVIDLQTLAKSQRAWQYAFGVESESGEAMVKAFVAAKGGREDIGRVQSGPVMQSVGSAAASEDEAQSKSASPPHQAHGRHYHVAVGGTFDHIHIGHKLLLTMTVFAVDESSEARQRSATIGITGDQLLVNKKHASVLESWEDRQRIVDSFIASLVDFAPASHSKRRQITTRSDPGPNGKSVDIHYPNGLTIKCTEIQDPFGPTITEEAISALIISAETRSGGKAVNDKRKDKGWKELDVFEVDVLDADEDGDGAAKEGFESKISSTAIREKIAKKTAESRL